MDSSVDSDQPADTGWVASNCDELFWSEPGDLVLDSQAKVNAVCETSNAIAGSISVDLGLKEAPIASLHGLECLCEVSGDLVFFGRPIETKAQGAPPPHRASDLPLAILTRVGGDLVVQDVIGLSFLTAMTSLEEIGGSLVLDGNLLTTHIQFDQLKTLGGGLQVRSHPWLAELSLPALETAGGSVSLLGGCNTEPLFPLLRELGDLTIQGQCGMADFSGLAALTEVGGMSTSGDSIVLTNNDELNAKEIDAFVSGLTLTGTGAVMTAPAPPGCDAWFQEIHGVTADEFCPTI